MKYNRLSEDDSAKIQALILEIYKAKIFNPSDLRKLLRKYPSSNGIFSRDNLISTYKQMLKDGLKINTKVMDRIKMKPTRTVSGVAPVTVLTKPYPCPGKCIFCPTDVRMPKSYLSSEPGAQRAERNNFDPYLQTYNRLLAFSNTGHNTNKVELIILGGTWSYYPRNYRLWFIKRCFDAMNDFPQIDRRGFTEKEKLVTWAEICAVQKTNEIAITRNVGLVVETRPDYITIEELTDLRKLGVTKIQIGVQSLNDKILKLNGRGHTSAQIKKAISLIRQFGFKIHIHTMPNLYGSTVEMDKKDYAKILAEIQPDEVKIYPTSVIKNTALYSLFKQGSYKPYSYDELLDILKYAMSITPRYCRLTRVVRDIPSQDIEAGNKHSNFRQIAENSLIKDGNPCECIRCREIKQLAVNIKDLELEEIHYTTDVSQEVFLSYKTKKNDKIVGFLRLSLPFPNKDLTAELKNSAIIREIHVYGEVVNIGAKATGRAQHLGIGKKLMILATKIVKEQNYKKLAVISAIGTREYYNKNGFTQAVLYQFKDIS